MTTRVRPMTREQYQHLIAVSRFQEPATIYIHGAQILNVYTGEIQRLNVALADEWIAYVGEKTPLLSAETKVIDAERYTLVPGYIEPHVHSFQGYNPQTFSDFAAVHGTTVLLHDNLSFFLHRDQETMESLFKVMARFPVKNFWWCRLDPQVKQQAMSAKFTLDRIERTLHHPLVLQAGELTFWKDLIDGDETMLDRAWLVRQSGKRLETHNPGASVETLNSVAAAGATACHESISSEGVRNRVRLGYYAALRHSSIRPDLSALVQGLLQEGFQAWQKLFYTTDGSPPFFLTNGLIDDCIRIALDAGLDPIVAYQMASLNPAVYYGLDAEVGGISPGRVADILFLEDLRNPHPVRVIANGRIIAENGKLTKPSPTIDWAGMLHESEPNVTRSAEPDWFEVESMDGQAPVIVYSNAVITRFEKVSLPVVNGKVQLSANNGFLYGAFLNRENKWIATAIVSGLGEFDGLATTYSLTGDLIVLGRDKGQMTRAVNHVQAAGGGITLFHNGELIYHLPLPLLGTMSLLDMGELIGKTNEFVQRMREFGYTYADPIYSLLFLSATHLPAVRFGEEGLIDVKANRIVLPRRMI